VGERKLPAAPRSGSRYVSILKAAGAEAATAADGDLARRRIGAADHDSVATPGPAIGASPISRVERLATLVDHLVGPPGCEQEPVHTFRNL